MRLPCYPFLIPMLDAPVGVRECLEKRAAYRPISAWAIRDIRDELRRKSPDRRVSPAKLESHGTLAPFDHREV